MDFLTAENDCKWGYAEPEYYGCTKTLEFAESCNMDYRYSVQWMSFIWKMVSFNMMSDNTVENGYCDYLGTRAK